MEIWRTCKGILIIKRVERGTIMKYDVTFTRYGFAEIEASSEEEAYAVAEAYGAEDISWSDEFCTSDVQEAE